MRVLQLIDSLNAGGAERVAVNYANGLVGQVERSYLCSTRAEGLLKSSINNQVGYLFLNKTKTLDFKAIKRLTRFIKQNNINLIHAHSSSFFIATFVKLLHPKLQLVWHDHYGNRINTPRKEILIFQICSIFFSKILVVNNDLKKWSKKKMLTKHIHYINNYPLLDYSIKQTVLKGVDNKRIICLANLRPVKNHPFLIKSFKKILKNHPDWTLHLVGQNNNDNYSERLKYLIKSLQLNKNVFFYGSCPDIANILNQVEIGVLSSKSEGLPIALLEYGLNGIATIATDVGYCRKIISNFKNGLLIESNNSEQMVNSIEYLINNTNIRQNYSSQLRRFILENYSESSTLNRLLEIYKQ
ncbi:glycosyltransferase [Postechiella marina]|uniref:Glycosyltransferase n=1 Tax=Postechiella marina TaxID=943941 RepID=A0ABP8C987_9FLAO